MHRAFSEKKLRADRIDWVFRVVGGCLSQQPHHRSLNSLRVNEKKGKIPVIDCWFHLNVRGGWVLFLHSEPSEQFNHPPREIGAIQISTL
jgi:hypothetical protein